MRNRWVIKAQKISGLSITHWWHRLLIDVIDYSSMTHRSRIDYYTAHERHFSCFLVPFVFVCDSFFCVRPMFCCIWSFCCDVEALSANHKYKWFSIVQYFTLPNWTVTNQSQNETNKYAFKNRLRGYRIFCGCLSAKWNCFGVGKHPS